jgi:plastocyanin
MRALAIALALLPSGTRAAPAGGTVTGRLAVVQDGKRIATPADQPAYVYLVELPPQRRKARPGDHAIVRIIQRAEQFDPKVRVVSIGTTVVFPNDDFKEHNVFSPTAVDQFDLGRYDHGPGRRHKFDDPGDIDVYCDIHKDMRATVKVVDSAWIAPVTDGAFTLTDVPPGSYKVVGWARDSSEAWSDPITVVAGATTKLADELHPRFRKTPTMHTRKDGSPYPPY